MKSLKNKTKHQTKKLIQTGEIEIKKFCERCGNGGKLHCHHNNYEDPGDVTFLCPRCHRTIHVIKKYGIRYYKYWRQEGQAVIDVTKLLYNIPITYECNPKSIWANFIRREISWEQYWGNCQVKNDV